jgi:hypothetical protein
VCRWNAGFCSFILALDDYYVPTANFAFPFLKCSLDAVCHDVYSSNYFNICGPYVLYKRFHLVITLTHKAVTPTGSKGRYLLGALVVSPK